MCQFRQFDHVLLCTPPATIAPLTSIGRSTPEWLDEIAAIIVTGAYTDPSAGQVTSPASFGEWSARQVWPSGTVLAMSLATSAVPFSDKPLRQVRWSHVEVLIESMHATGLAPGTVITRCVECGRGQRALRVHRPETRRGGRRTARDIDCGNAA